MEKPPAFGRFDSSELFADFRAEQLAERRPPTSVADIFVWRDLCDALSHFRRSDGPRTRQAERAAYDGDADWSGGFENLDGGSLMLGDGASLWVF